MSRGARAQAYDHRMTAGTQPRPRRFIRANDVLSGQWTGEGYPFRYVVIWHNKEIVTKVRNSMIDTVLSAVELLESRGWQLVTLDESMSQACLRRPTAEAPRRAGW